VASVKPRASGNSYAGRTHWDLPDGFIATDATVQLLILQSYQLLPYRLSGGPGWLATERFDINAKADRRITDDEKRAMVRALLEDRFKLKIRRETHDVRTYALVRAYSDGRLGPNLKKSACQQPCGVIGGFSLLISNGMDMRTLAQRLEPTMGTPVADQTGLDGLFEWRLQFSADSAPGTPAQFATESQAPSIFTALQEQLGLKLEPRRGPVETFVIDSVERPTSD